MNVNMEGNIFSRIIKLTISGFDLYKIFLETPDYRSDARFPARLLNYFEEKKVISKDLINLCDSAKEWQSSLNSFRVQISRLKNIRGSRKRVKFVEHLKQRTILIPFVLSNTAAKLQHVQHELPYSLK
jgi:hypothetical protein